MSENSLYILVSSEVENAEIENYRYVIAGDLSLKVKYKLHSAITDHVLEFNKKILLDNIEQILHSYASEYPDKEYITLFSHIFYYEILYFNHYYAKLKKHILNLPTPITKIVVSSKSDFVLNSALNELSSELALQIKFQNNAFSLAYAYYPLVDLLESELSTSLDLLNFSYVIGIFSKIKSIIFSNRIYYENYHNLDKKELKFSISYFQIINRLINKVFSKKSIFKDKNYYDNPCELNERDIYYFRDCGYKKNESILIVILIQHIFQKYNLKIISPLEKRIKKYFLLVNPEFIIVNDIFAASSRLFIKVAKKLNIQTMYLPHGVLNYDRILNGAQNYKMDYFLAWTPYALEKYQGLKIPAKKYRHNHLKNYFQIKSDLKRAVNLNKKKPILVIASSGDFDQPDEYLRDIYDIYKVFKSEFNIIPEFKIRKLSVKFNDKFNFIKNIYQLCESENIELREANGLSLIEVIYDYSFIVICGHTTAIIEVISSSIPYVIYSRSFIDVDHADINKLPIVNNLEQLASFYKFSKFEKYREFNESYKKSINKYISN